VFRLQFGHALQQLLTTVPYSEVAGQRYVEWDSQHTCANVMSMLLLRPLTLASLGRHHQTNEPIPDALVTNVLKGCESSYVLIISVCCDTVMQYGDNVVSNTEENSSMLLLI